MSLLRIPMPHILVNCPVKSIKGLSSMKRRLVVALVLAIVLPVGTLMICQGLPVSFGEYPLLILFMPALLAIPLLGGVWPGLMATATTALLVTYSLFPPVGQVWIAQGHDLLQWSMLIISGVMASLVGERLIQSRAGMEASLARLQQSSEENEIQRRRLNDILEGTHVGTWEWNVQTGEVIFNERWAGIIGYTLDELSPLNIRTWMELAHPDDLKKSEELLAKHFSGAFPYYECEARMKHKDGHWVWVLDKGRVSSRADDGTPLTVSGTHQDIAERKLAEERMQLWVQAFERSDIGVAIGNPQGDVLLAINPAFAKRRGYAREELVGQPVSMLFVPDRLAHAMQQIRLAHQTGHINFESEHLCKDGRRFPVMLDITVIKDAHGQPVQRCVYSIDISERKLAEAELMRYRASLEEQVLQRTEDLRTANRKLSAMQYAMDQAGIGIHWADKQTGRFRYVNEYAAAMLGYSVDEMLALGIPDIDPNFSPDDFEAAATQAFAGGKAHFETLNKAKDGRLVPVDVVGYRMPATADEPSGFITFVSDISARRAADEQLRSSQKSLAEAQRIANLGSWRLNLATNEVVWSEELYRLFDADPTQPPPNYSVQASIFTPESWHTLTAALANTVATGVPYELELQTRRADGSSGWILARGERICDDAGNTVAMHGIAMDIAQQKDAERLINEAREAAEAANIAKSAFLANMSHEIRTPLNAIIGMAHILRRSGLTPQQTDKLDKIEAAGNHLLTTINAILDLSKIEASKFTLEDAPVSVEVLLANVASILSQKAHDKGCVSTSKPSLCRTSFMATPPGFSKRCSTMRPMPSSSPRPVTSPCG
jgi:two-component system sensor histidine kinase/response regulator